MSHQETHRAVGDHLLALDDVEALAVGQYDVLIELDRAADGLSRDLRLTRSTSTEIRGVLIDRLENVSLGCSRRVGLQRL